LQNTDIEFIDDSGGGGVFVVTSAELVLVRAQVSIN